MVDGIGIDIVDLPRFRRAMERWGGRFTTRLFTKAELDYCTAQRRPADHFAARFAAKVSFMKACGEFISFKKIEITRDAVGRPALKVAGVGEMAIAVTMSHDGDLAIAEVIIKKSRA